MLWRYGTQENMSICNLGYIQYINNGLETYLHMWIKFIGYTFEWHECTLKISTMDAVEMYFQCPEY